MWRRVRKPESALYRALCFAARYVVGRLYEIRTGGIPPDREWASDYMPLRRVDAYGWPEQAFLVRGRGPLLYHAAIREIDGSADVGKSLATFPVTAYTDFADVICDGWRLQ